MPLSALNGGIKRLQVDRDVSMVLCLRIHSPVPPISLAYYTMDSPGNSSCNSPSEGDLEIFAIEQPIKVKKLKDNFL